MIRVRLASIGAAMCAAVVLHASDWPMFGRNASHAAASRDVAPSDLNVATHQESPTLGIKPDSAPVIVDGQVYVYAGGSPAGMLYCLDAVSLAVIWSNTVAVEDTGWGSWATPAVAQGRVVFCADDFLGCWLTNGVPQWTTNIMPAMNSSPVIASNRVFVGSFSYGNTTNAMAAYSLTNGAPLWVVSNVPVAFSSCTPTINVGAGVGYACCGSNVWAFDCATGTNVWDMALPCKSLQNVSYSSNTVLAVNYDMFASGPQTNLFALDATNGAVRWARVCGGSDVPPAVWRGTAVLACGDNATPAGLTAFNLFSGSQLWARTDVGHCDNMPAIAEGVVYAGLGLYAGFNLLCMTNFSAVSVADGSLLSRRMTDDGGHSTAIADSAVYTANNGSLHRYMWTATPLIVSRIKAKVAVKGGTKDSLTLSAYTYALPSVTNIGTEPITLTCGGATFVSSEIGAAKWNGKNFKWQFKGDGLSVKLAWSASRPWLTVNAKLSKTTLTDALPYSMVDGTVTNTLCTTLRACDFVIYVQSFDAVPATTKHGMATLQYKF